ncbi:MAG: elongation factor G [Mesorhizobium sp.]
MGKRAGDRRKGPKCIAIIGPFASGKTSLFEAILARTGVISKQGTVAARNTVGDNSPEARAHQMSVEASFATVSFMGETISFVDCPGSIEFGYEAVPVLAACDAAIVVAEADEKKIPALQLIMRQLDEIGLPRILFLNKVDRIAAGVRDTLKLLQPASTTPLLLRQIPLRKGDQTIGAIDLALERAYVWREQAESEVTDIPNDERARELEARFSMLERLADHDDDLMEQLLEDRPPQRDAVFDDLTADLRSGAVIPVLIGSAEHGNGILRLLKTIRHDGPDVSDTRTRLGLADGGSALRVMKTIHTSHGGKLSVARVLAGTIADGAEIAGPHGRTGKVAGMHRLTGKDQAKLTAAQEGDVVALGRLDDIATGDMIAVGKAAPTAGKLPGMAEAVFSMALRAKERKDDVKLSASLQRLAEEDPSLAVGQNQDTGETMIAGHGEMHLRVAIERLEGRYQIPIEAHQPSVPYRETIRKGVQQRGRHKKQSGGHGQFGDVLVEIKPLARGEGFQFTDTITGGVVPKTYIQSVETGIRDYLKTGPFGFPVVDVAVNLSDGSYHAVDSSDMAFQMAARLAMKEGMPACSPVLLEPVMKVEIATPSEATARVTALIPQRRGQILGYDARAGWDGWDLVEALMPQSELGSLIVELRSVSSGVASYIARFDHMAELTGRMADEVMNAHGRAA